MLGKFVLVTISLLSLLLPLDRADAQPSAWEPLIEAPGLGGTVSGLGFGIGNLDQNASPDLIAVVRTTKPDGAPRLAYRIGWNLTEAGRAASWSEPIDGPYPAGESVGVGVALATIDNDARPDI